MATNNTKNNTTKVAQTSAVDLVSQQESEVPCAHDCHPDPATVDVLTARVTSLETQILNLVDEVAALRQQATVKQPAVAPAGQDLGLRNQVCEALRLLGARDWVLTQSGLK